MNKVYLVAGHDYWGEVDMTELEVYSESTTAIERSEELKEKHQTLFYRVIEKELK